MINTRAPANANSMNETIEMLCNNAVTIVPSVTAPILFLVTRRKKSLKVLPELFFNAS